MIIVILFPSSSFPSYTLAHCSCIYMCIYTHKDTRVFLRNKKKEKKGPDLVLQILVPLKVLAKSFHLTAILQL